jgi:hypothetical protein
VQNLSAGGNCCEDPLSTGIEALAAPPANALQLDRAGDLLTVHTSRTVLVIDASGRMVRSLAGTPEGRSRIDTATLPVGAYVLREQEGSGYARFIVAR